MPSIRSARLIPVALALFASAIGSASGLWIELGNTRTGKSPSESAEAAVRRLNANLAELTRNSRSRWKRLGLFRTPLSFPTTVRFTENGRVLNAATGVAGDITLKFRGTGPRAFPNDYRDLLQSVFDQARPVLNTVFGMPALGGQVVISNYDADIADREAVSGGFYLPDNGSGIREIRFPIYTQSEAAAVNFIHCLLLAYQGNTPYAFDAYEEGVVRAATMRVARTPGAVPATLDRDLIENALDSTYDVGSFYDWYNQRPLGGPSFIAPNLRDLPLPAGGSVGGLYLLRYQMGGTAWQKALVENPGFIAEFNRRFYAEPGAADNVARLTTLAQEALDAVKGGADSKIEGLSFADWSKRQFILSTVLTLGPKVLVQPVPFPPEAGTADFGVYDVAVHYFETQAGGNEALLSATSFPIFWDPDFNRVTPSAQDSTLSIAGGYASVTPNFPDFFSGTPYRIAIDIPIFDRIARAYVPAGGVATSANPDGNDAYGTVVGLPATGASRVSITFNGATFETPVTNGAFGFDVNPAFLSAQRLKVEVIRNDGTSDAVLLRRNINKGPGTLGMDLRVGGDDVYSAASGLSKGINAISVPLDPFESAASALLGVPENEVQLARYDASKVAYDFYPETGPITIGGGYFARLNNAKPFEVEGRSSKNVRTAISTRPGWNLIGSPLPESTPTNRILIVRGTEPPKPLNEALGIELGIDFFTFIPGAPDPVTGAPETGAFTSATTFEPGRAYFVRVMVPEGVTLLFAPSSDTRGTTSAPRPAVTGWRVQGTLTGDGRADIIFGQSKSGTPGFEAREDSLAPPSFGGLRAILGSAGFYRDVRRLKANDTYEIKLSGLRVGKLYRMDFALKRGAQPALKLIDPQAGVERNLTLPKGYSFRPQGTTYKLMVVAGGSQ